MFVGHELDNNGDQFMPSSTLTGKELNVQATVQPGP
jgi:hypothetical protein